MKWVNKEFCDECGEPNDMDSDFCVHCGADLTPDQKPGHKGTPKRSDAPRHAPGSTPDRSKRLILWFFMVILIVILMCLKK